MKRLNSLSMLAKSIFSAAMLVGCLFLGNTLAADTKLKGDIPVVIKTNLGDIKAVVYASKVPVTAASFEFGPAVTTMD